MYVCETWSTTQGDKEKLITFERKILWKIHGLVRLQNGEYERRKYEDLEMLFSKPNIRLFLKTKHLEWASHVWRAAESLTRIVLTKNLPKKTTKRKTTSEMVRQCEEEYFRRQQLKTTG